MDTYYYRMKTVTGDFYMASRIALRSTKQATDLLHEPVYEITILNFFQYLWGKFNQFLFNNF